MKEKIDIRARLATAEARYESLISQNLVPVQSRRTLSQVPAIYVFYDSATPVHVGRCRKLRDRINGQCSGTVYSSSFAFKKTRERVANMTGDERYLRAAYKWEWSRKELFSREHFRAEFNRVIEWIKSIHLRFLHVEDDVDQYLLELVTANELRVSIDEFGTT